MVYTKEAFPEQYGVVQMNIAMAFGARLKGERRHNTQEEIERSEMALAALTREEHPVPWGILHT